LFRRTKTAETAPESTALKEGGKGRPTPSRKEAEAAARARAKAGMDKKAASKRFRDAYGHTPLSVDEARTRAPT